MDALNLSCRVFPTSPIPVAAGRTALSRDAAEWAITFALATGAPMTGETTDDPHRPEHEDPDNGQFTAVALMIKAGVSLAAAYLLMDEHPIEAVVCVVVGLLFAGMGIAAWLDARSG